MDVPLPAPAICQHAGPGRGPAALMPPTAWVQQMQHMAGDNFPTHAQRGGWNTDSGHRGCASGRHAHTRFAPSASPVSEFRLTLPAEPANIAIVRRVLE